MSGRLVGAWTIGDASPGAVRGTRREIGETFRGYARSDSDVQDCIVILGELIANACEHGLLPVTLEMHAEDRGVTLTVSDAGNGIVLHGQPDVESLRGRGFQIIANMARAVHIAPPPRSAVCVLLPL